MQNMLLLDGGDTEHAEHAPNKESDPTGTFSFLVPGNGMNWTQPARHTEHLELLV